MLYDERNGFASGHSDDTEPDPQQLLDDLAALIDAGLVVALRDRDGEVRMTPADPLRAAGDGGGSLDRPM